MSAGAVREALAATVLVAVPWLLLGVLLWLMMGMPT